MLIGITILGKSPNVVQALHEGCEKSIVTIGLLGGDGNPAVAECDLALVVPLTVTGRIQETHITVGHALMELVEDLLLEHGYLTKR